MAIDINDLHIGSHVNMCGERQRITYLDTLNGWVGIENYVTDDDGVKHPIAYKTEDIDPVPLTDGLLTSLGFRVIKHDGFDHWYIGNFDLTKRSGGLYYRHDGGIELDCLHELETLYRLKYGVELIKE